MLEDYYVATAENAEVLAREVKTRIRAGWAVSGGVAMYNHPTRNLTKYAQALVRRPLGLELRNATTTAENIRFRLEEIRSGVLTRNEVREIENPPAPPEGEVTA